MAVKKLIRFIAFQLFIIFLVLPFSDSALSVDSDGNLPYVDDRWDRPHTFGPSSATGKNLYVTTKNDKKVVMVLPDAIPVTDPDPAMGYFSGACQSSSNVLVPQESGSLVLDTVESNPFVDTLGQWSTLPTVPRPSQATAYVYAPSSDTKYLYCLFAAGDGRAFARYDIDQAAPEKIFNAAVTTEPGEVNTGVHFYSVTYVVGTKEINKGDYSNPVRITDSAKIVELTNIPQGPAGCTARKLYRTTSGSFIPKYLGTISGNGATTYTDNIPDSIISPQANPALTVERERAWEFLEPLPKPASDGAVLVYDGMYVYALRGSGSSEFYRFEMPSATNPRGKWHRMADVTTSVYKGACMVNCGGPLYNADGSPANGVLYLKPGYGNSTPFLKFTPSYIDDINQNAGWSNDTSPTIPGLSSYWGLTYAGGDYIYLFFSYGVVEGYTTKYYPGVIKYSLLDYQWSPVAPIPTINATPYDPVATPTQLTWTSDNMAIYYPGRGKFIYVRNKLRLFKLNTLNDGWEEMPIVPYGNGIGPYQSVMLFPDVTKTPSQLSASEKNNSSGQMYLFSGLHYTSPLVLQASDTAATSRWSSLQSPENPSKQYGMNMVYPGYDSAHPNAEKFIYYVGSKGNYYETTPFYRYDLENNKWEELKPVPAGVKWNGNRLTYLDGNIYCLAGNAWPNPQDNNKYYIKVLKYGSIDDSPQAAQWTELDPFPLNTSNADDVKTMYGSSIMAVKVGSDTCLYLLRSCDTTIGFYRYNVTNPTTPTKWVLLNNLSLPYYAFSGSYLAYDGGDHIYVARGAWTGTIYDYSISQDRWRTVNTCPFGFGKDYMTQMYYTEVGDFKYIYALAGVGGSEGNGYRIARAKILADASLGTWEELEPSPFPQPYTAFCAVFPKAGSSDTSAGSIYKGIYALPWNDAGFYKYGFDTNKWSEGQYDRDNFHDGSLVIDENDNIYFFLGSSEYWTTLSSHIWVYSTKENGWIGLIRAPFRLYPGSKAIYVPGLNGAYVSKGGGSKKVYYCTIPSAGSLTWSSSVTQSPRFFRSAQMALGPQTGTGASAKRIIYVIPGYQLDSSQTATFYSFTVPIAGKGTESWNSQSSAQTLPATGYSCTTLAALNDVAYVLQNNTNKVWYFNAAELVFKPFADLVVDENNIVSFDGGSLFPYEYTDAGGAHRYLYCIPAKDSDMMLAYSFDDPAAGWQRMAKLPCAPNGFATMAVKTNQKPWFYIINNRWGYLMRYKPLDNNGLGIWDEPAYSIAPFDYRIATCGYKGYIYYLRYNEFYRYNTSTDAWEILTPPIYPLTNWNPGVIPVEWDGDAYLYAISGYNTNTFQRYSISKNTWESLDNLPFTNYWGTCLAWNGKYIYALQGNGSTGVWRYNLNTKHWDGSTDVPDNLKDLRSGAYRGATMVAANNCLYVLKGWWTTTFWKYDFSDVAPNRDVHVYGNTSGWVPQASCPVAMFDTQSQLAYPGFGKYLYLLQGSSADDNGDYSNTFLKFNMDPGGGWEEVSYGLDITAATYSTADELKAALITRAGGLATPLGIIINGLTTVDKTAEDFLNSVLNAVSPKDAQSLGISPTYSPCPYGLMTCATLVYPGGNYFYVLGGRDTARVGRFMPFAVGEFISKPKAVGVHNSWGEAIWEGTNLSGIKVAVRTGNNSDMSDALDWGSVADVTRNVAIPPSASAKPRDKYIQYKIAFSTSDLKFKPSISSVTLKYMKYPLMQELISAPFNTAFDKNRIYDVKWDELVMPGEPSSEKTGKSLRFQIKAASTSAGLNDPTCKWRGEKDTQQIDYGFIDTGLSPDVYVMDRDIGLINGNAQLSASTIYRQTITIDNRDAAVAGASAPLEDYQVLINITPDSETFWNAVRTDGRDIRFAFYDEQGKIIRLPYWVKEFDYQGKTASIYVKVPVIAQNSDQNTIYLYYGVKSSTSESSFTDTMEYDYTGENFSDLAELLLGFDPAAASSSPTGAPDKKDTDKDGFSDIVENLMGSDPKDSLSKPDFTADRDGDGFSNFIEVVMGSGPDNISSTPDFMKDSDSDGFPDIVELCNGLNPYSAASKPDDSDGDGFSDIVEQLRGTDEWDELSIPQGLNNDPDTDGDGYSDWFEYIMGSDRQVQASAPNINKDSDSDTHPDILEKLLDSNSGSASSVPNFAKDSDNDSGLVGSWNFDEIKTVGSTKYIMDSTSTGANGTLGGARYFLTQGMNGGGAVNFNRNGWVSVPSYYTQFDPGQNGTNELTVEAWIKFDRQFGDWIRVVQRGGWGGQQYGWEVQQNQAGSNSMTPDYGTKDGANVFAPVVSFKPNQWQHFVFAMDVNPSTGSGKSYVNGISQGGYGYVTYKISSNNLYLGTNSLNATFDHVRIYNRLLASSEVAAHYECRKYTPRPPVVALSTAAENRDSDVFQNWTKRQPIVVTVNTTIIASDKSSQIGIITIGDTVKNQPFWDYVSSQGASYAGEDLRISDGYPMPYKRRILLLDKVNKKAVIFVKFPYLSVANPSTTVYLYYNNPGVSSGDSPLSEFISTQDLAGYWSFKDGAGSMITDDSGNNHSGQIQGAAWDTDGKLGNCLKFLSNSWVDIAPLNELGLNRDFTAVAWIKPSALSSTGFNPVFAINSPGLNFGITYNNFASKLYFEYNTVNTTGVANLTTDEWYHVSYRYSSAGGMAIFLNGDIDKTITSGASLSGVTDTLRLANKGSSYFYGRIDEVYIYNRALSDAEIKNLALLPDVITADFLDSENNQAGAYSMDNPVVQPVFGVFYDSRPDSAGEIPLIIDSFSAAYSDMPEGTAVRYQFSDDGWHWYWLDINGTPFDTSDDLWKEASLGYDEATEDIYITHEALVAFQEQHTAGDFIFRAYLHSENGTGTPKLDRVMVLLTSDMDSYYVNPVGCEAINPLHRDIKENRWFQYKVTFYSDGENVPILDKVQINYANPAINVTFPNIKADFQAKTKRNITWTSTGLRTKMPPDTGTVSLSYSTTGTNGTYTQFATGVDAGAGTCELTIPDVHTDQFAIRVHSDQFGVDSPPTNVGVSDASDVVSSIYNFELTWPLSAGKKVEQGIQYQVTWLVHGTIAHPVQVYLVRDGYPSTKIWLGPETGQTYYRWTVEEDPALLGDGWRIRVEDGSAPIARTDTSDFTFTIAPKATIALTAPPAQTEINPPTTTFVAGETYHVSWNKTGIVPDATKQMTYKYYIDPTNNFVFPEYLDPNAMTDDPAKWNNVTPVSGTLQLLDNGGSMDWKVPDAIIDYTDPAAFGPKAVILKIGEDSKREVYSKPVASMANIIVNPPSITIDRDAMGLNAGPLVWVVGDVGRTIIWTKEGGLSYPLKVQYSTSYWDRDTNPEAVSWVPIVTISQPVGGGDVLSYTWENKIGNQKMGIPPEAAINNWDHPVYLRVVDSHSNDLVVSEPVPVTILDHHEIELITPDKDLLNGESVTIRWNWYGETKTANGDPAVEDLVLELSTDGGATWPPRPIASANMRMEGLPNVTIIGAEEITGASWRVPEVQTDTAVLRIYGAFTDPGDKGSYTLYSETSRTTPFRIKVPKITFGGPVLGEPAQIYKNGEYKIEWTTVGDFGGAGGTVTIQYRLSDDGTTWPSTWTNIQAGVLESRKEWTWRIPLQDGASDIAGKKIQIRILSDKWRQGAPEGDSKVKTAPPLEATIIEPTVTKIVNPSSADTGPEAWVVGNTYDPSWEISAGALEAKTIYKFKVYYSTKTAPVWPGDFTPITPDSDVLAADTNKVNVVTNTATTQWALSGSVPTSENAFVRVVIYYSPTNASVLEFKSQPFTVAPPRLEVEDMQYPSYRIGETPTIKWYPTGAVIYPIKLLYSYDETGVDWTTPELCGVIATYNNPSELTRDTENNCLTPWELSDHLIPEAPHKVYIKAVDSGTGASKIISDPLKSFNLLPPLIVPTVPTDRLYSTSESMNITWDVTGVLRGPVTIKWLRVNSGLTGNIGEISVEDVASGVRSKSWTDIPANAAGADVVIIVDDNGWLKEGQQLSKIANQTNLFTILPEPQLNVTLPVVPGNIWRIGETRTISWNKTNSGNTGNSFKLDLWSGGNDTGQSVHTIAEATSGPWVVNFYLDPDHIRKAYRDLRVRVYDNSVWNEFAPLENQKHATAFSSDSNKIQIAIPAITLNYPKTIESVALNDFLNINWSTSGYSSPNGIKIDLILDPEGYPDSRNITRVATNTSGTSNSGNFAWLVDRTENPATGPKIVIPPGSDHIDARIVITDSKEYEDADNPGNTVKVTDQSVKFRIVRAPKIEDISIAKSVPVPGDPYPLTFKLGATADINWKPVAVAVRKVKIVYYKVQDPDHQEMIADNVPNTGHFSWNIESDRTVGRELILKVIGYRDASGIDDGNPDNDVIKNDGTDIFGEMPATFRLRGDINIASPTSTTKMLAKFEPLTGMPNVSWTTAGIIKEVQLEYTIDGGATWHILNNGAAKDVPSDVELNIFGWNVPDIPNVTKDSYGNFQKPEPLEARIRIRDMEDVRQEESGGDVGERTEAVSAPFYIDYCKVTWTIFDIDTYAKQSNFTVSEYLPGIEMPVSIQPALGPEFTRYYPYGMRITEFENDEYLTSSKTWTPESASDKSIAMYLQNRLLASVEWHVLVAPVYTVNYDTSGGIIDKLNVTCWLEKKGKIVGLIQDEIDNFHGSRIEIYDGETFDPATGKEIPFKSIEDPAIDEKGTFSYVWDSPGLVSGKNYFVKAFIKYGVQITGKDVPPDTYPEYVSGAAINVTELREQLEQKTALSEQISDVNEAVMDVHDDLAAAATNIITAVGTARDDIVDSVKETQTTLANKVDAAKSAIIADTSKILVAAETTLPSIITQAQTEIQNTQRSEILNRENSVRSGQKLTIRYRTPSSSPVMDIYDPKNKQRIAKAPMLPATDAEGIYEYTATFSQGWGYGDYTIVCSDSGGNMDAMIISVLRTDLEDISGQVAAVLGSTSQMSNLKEVADNMSTQFGMIETALSKIGRDFNLGSGGMNTKTLEGIESVFDQLSTMAAQLKQYSGETNVNLEKLYDVSTEKKSDITYLKNKTQQLRAAMEVSKKMMDNIANKPVTQTWYEYK